MPPLPDLTWAALLAKWTVLAKASDRFPRSPAGDRWRAAVPPIITLQAVTLALRDSASLAPGEHALASAKAGVLIRGAASTLNSLWMGEPFPDELALLVQDATIELRVFQALGVQWTLSDSAADTPDGESALARLDPAELSLLLLPAPGETLLPGTPVAFARARTGGTPPPSVLVALDHLFGPGVVREPSGPHQVYRQTNPDTGGVARDLVAPLDATLPPGRPLLHLWIEDGQRRPSPPPARSRQAQLTSVGPWRVVACRPDPPPGSE